MQRSLLHVSRSTSGVSLLHTRIQTLALSLLKIVYSAVDPHAFLALSHFAAWLIIDQTPNIATFCTHVFVYGGFIQNATYPHTLARGTLSSCSFYWGPT